MDRETFAILAAGTIIPGLLFMASEGLLASTVAWIIFAVLAGGNLVVFFAADLERRSVRVALFWLGGLLLLGGTTLDSFVFH